jgi:hypothetical protein
VLTEEHPVCADPARGVCHGSLLEI